MVSLALQPLMIWVVAALRVGYFRYEAKSEDFLVPLVLSSFDKLWTGRNGPREAK